MVRHYKRKKEKTYSESQILNAVDDVKNNRLTSSQAAELHGVPRTTINTRLKCVQHTPGRPTVFSADIEMRIANNLHIMEKHGFLLSRKEASVLISEYVRQNGIYTPFSNDMPGKDWFYGFQKRNNLSIKKPQLVEMARRKACDPFTVYGYFEMLEKVIEELGLQDKPQQIYNLDETSIRNDPIKGKVVRKKGYPSTSSTSGPGRNNTTVLLATNACGEKVPPLIIFEGKHLWSEWIYPNENVKTAYAVSEKGWMETTIFEKYLRETFEPAIGDKRPALLIFDGHSTHVDLSVIEYAASAGITLVKLPPNSSHILQPLDCSTLKPLKDRWEDEIIKWQRLHIGTKLPKQEFARLLTKVWDEMDPVILQNGFRKTGAYPANPEAIRKELFDFTLLQKWESFKTQQVQQHEPQTEYTAEENNMTEVPSLFFSTLEKPDKKQEPRSNHKGVELKTNHDPNTEQKQKTMRNNKIEEIQTSQLKNHKSNKDIKKEKPTVDRHKKLQVDRKKDDELTVCWNKEDSVPDERNSEPKIIYQPHVNDLKLSLDIPKRINKNKMTCSLQTLRTQITQPRTVTPGENLSFETLLLKTIARNDPPVNRKRRVTNNKAEILTYNSEMEKNRKEKEEKSTIQQNKLKRKIVQTQKEKKIQKKTKIGNNTRRQTNTKIIIQSDIEANITGS